MGEVAPIQPHTFYGSRQNEFSEKIEKIIQNKRYQPEPPKMPTSLLGPNQLWLEFDKQVDALNTAFEKTNEAHTFCTFVYQKENGYRKFVVAHPEVYWWYYNHEGKLPETRCTYEVIPMSAPCRIYLDLEFLIELNPNNNGPRMTNTIIEIICAYLLNQWSFPCSKTNIVNLDSTTAEKFSRHLIFSIKNIAFENNFHVGRFIKYICCDIENYLHTECAQNDILNSFERSNLEELFIETKSGKKIFIDTGVYTKNRHFRIYKSTKWGKQSHLKVAPESRHIPLQHYKKDPELGIFLDSLISYFPRKKDLLLFEFFDDHAGKPIMFQQKMHFPIHYEDNCRTSPFPKLDEYIKDTVKPGGIRTCKYFDSSKTVIYEIYGNRYCENIGRWHKSNNILWIVDLHANVMYQKCHDEDCKGFKSVPKQLPNEIIFQLDEDDDLFETAALVEDILQNDLFCDSSN